MIQKTAHPVGTDNSGQRSALTSVSDLKRSAKMNPLDREGRSELHYAARDGDLVTVEKLVADGADVNLQDKLGWSPLHFAAQARSAEVASYLLAHGALVDVADHFGNTPLSRATFESRGDGSVIRVLRAAGADPEQKNKSGVSPLALARSVANFDVAQFYDDLRTPNQSLQRNAGSRPSSGDSSASETPSSLGPRG